MLGSGGTFVGVHSLVTLAQVVGEHSVVCCSHSNLIHRLWVVLGAAHIGLDVNLSHRVGLVCRPYLHRKAAACQPSPHQCIRAGQNKESCCFLLAQLPGRSVQWTADCKENCCIFLAWLLGRTVRGIAVCKEKIAYLPDKSQMYQLCSSDSRLSTN